MQACEDGWLWIAWLVVENFDISRECNLSVASGLCRFCSFGQQLDRCESEYPA